MNYCASSLTPLATSFPRVPGEHSRLLPETRAILISILWIDNDIFLICIKIALPLSVFAFYTRADWFWHFPYLLFQSPHVIIITSCINIFELLCIITAFSLQLAVLQMNGVAIDWVTKNVYWTDAQYKVIGVKPVYASIHTWKAIVDSDLSSPQDIVVNPLRRLVRVSLFQHLTD